MVSGLVSTVCYFSQLWYISCERIDLQYLWSPNDHSLAYASHVQVATEERLNDDYAIENDSLQDDTDTIRVSAIEGSQLKPMSIKNSL